MHLNKFFSCIQNLFFAVHAFKGLLPFTNKIIHLKPTKSTVWIFCIFLGIKKQTKSTKKHSSESPAIAA